MQYFAAKYPIRSHVVEEHHRRDLEVAAMSVFNTAPVDVSIFFNKSRGKGHAVITVADTTAIHRLAMQNNEFQLMIRGASVSFKKSNRTAPMELVEQLRKMAAVNVQQVRQLHTATDEFMATTPINTIAFGKHCEDGKFSPELEFSNGICGFQPDTKTMKISLRVDHDLYHIQIKFYNISRLHCLKNDASILLQLNGPPTYLKGESVDQQSRVAFLSTDHSRIAAFVSSTLLLRFASKRERVAFRKKCGKINIAPKRWKQVDIPIQPRNLYSQQNLDSLRRALVQFPLRAALQIEIILNSSILDSSQLVSLLPIIQEIYRLLQRDSNSSSSYIFWRVLIRITAQLRRTQPHRDLNFSQQEMENLMLEDVEEEEGEYETPITGKYASTEDLKRLLWSAYARYQENPPKERQVFPLIAVFQATLTAVGMHITYGFPEPSNHVLRLHNQPEFFLRVQIRDDELSPYFAGKDYNLSTFLHSRYFHLFSDGLPLAGRVYSFLGYSQSSLREHSTWWVTPFMHDREQVTAEHIRQGLGDFKAVENIPARWMARLAQSFTTTTPTVELERHQVHPINDVEFGTGKSKSCFSDGCGLISLKLARNISRHLSNNLSSSNKRKRATATVFQIRFGGVKGVVSVDPFLRGIQLHTRKSMLKYDAPKSLTMNVAQAFVRPLPAFLNRSLVKILEDLGVPPKVILQLQQDDLNEITASTRKVLPACTLLDRSSMPEGGQLSSTLKKLQKLLDESSVVKYFFTCPFIRDIIKLACIDARRAIKYRAHISIPGAYTLVGVLDESGYLKEGEIMVCTKEGPNSPRKYMSGRVCISRSPSLHPGDVRVVTAVGRPPVGTSPYLDQQNNVVVFSKHGTRSLPSMLAGGDLDGDIYVAIPENKHPGLIPRFVANPGNYDAPEMVKLNRRCTIEDGIRFFFDYITSDLLGVVSVRHLLIADQAPEGVFHPSCLELAGLASRAVDYPKTGVPVSVDDLKLIPSFKHLKPDFLQPEGFEDGRGLKNYYKSEKVLGRLFRSVPIETMEEELETRLDPSNDMTRLLKHLLKKNRLVLPDMEARLEDFRKDFRYNLEEFCWDLLQIARNCSISSQTEHHLSEEEVYCAMILSQSKNRNTRRSAAERLRCDAGYILKDYRNYIMRAEHWEETVDDQNEWDLEEEQDENPNENEDEDEVEQRLQEEDRVEEEKLIMRIYGGFAAWQVACEVSSDSNPDTLQYGVRTFGILGLSVFVEHMALYVEYMKEE